jgi:RNA polymerase sigma-70 factor (ECF subfamily)
MHNMPEAFLRRTSLMLFLLLLEDQPDDAAFLEEVYHAYYRLLYGQALKVLRHPQDAEDAVQTAMMKLTRKISLLRGLERNKLASYLVITVRNTAINLYRQNKTRAERQMALAPEAVTAWQEAGPEAQAMGRDAVERVKAAIRQLPQRERDAMMLRYVQELTDAQVADSLGIQPVSARALLSRGRKRLKQMLTEGGMLE